MKASIFAPALVAASLQGAQVHTLDVHSTAMGRDIKVSIVTPAAYAADCWTRYGVVYILHGAGNDHATYLKPEILDAVDHARVIAVMPDGANDWWMDSPVLPDVRREMFIVRELVPFVDSHCRTCANKAHRAIAGHSMGGQGAARIAMRHADLFGGAGVIMGGVDICAEPARSRKDIARVLGPYAGNEDRWHSFSVMAEAAKLEPNTLRLFITVGTEDFFLESNRALHRLLSKRGIAHEYTETRGETAELSRHSRAFALRAMASLLPKAAAFFAETPIPPIVRDRLRYARPVKIAHGEEPAASPDGEDIAFQRYVDGRPQIVVKHLADGKERVISPKGFSACHPSWTNDGGVLFTASHETKSAFAAQDDETGWNIYLWRNDNAGGSSFCSTACEQLTHGRAREFTASMAPDGTIYFVSEKILPVGGADGVFAGNRTGVGAFRIGEAAAPRTVAVLPDANTGIASPRVSPDGATLLRAEVAGYLKPWRIVLSPLFDTSRRQYVTGPDMTAYAPAWNPDGRTIAFSGCCEGDDGWHVYLAPRTGGVVERVAKGKNPAFAPDGRTLYFERDGDIFRMETVE